MCYLVGPTERQGKDIPGLDSGVNATKRIGSSHQLETDPLGHERTIMEGSADGHEAIVGHGGQQEALGCHVHHEEGQLDHTGLERDGLVRGQKVNQQLGCDHRRVTNIKKREDAEEEIHGAVEVRICEDERHHSQVARHCHGIDEQEASEKKLLEVWIIGESQQDELRNWGVVATGEG